MICIPLFHKLLIILYCFHDRFHLSPRSHHNSQTRCSMMHLHGRLLAIILFVLRRKLLFILKFRPTKHGLYLHVSNISLIICYNSTHLSYLKSKGVLGGLKFKSFLQQNSTKLCRQSFKSHQSVWASLPFDYFPPL